LEVRVRSRIGEQLILAVALISVTVFALLSFILITAQRRSLISQMQRHSTQFIETIRSSTRYAMMHNQREELDEIVDAIGRQPEIAKVRIFNKEGQIVYSPNESEKGNRVDMEAEACFPCHGTEVPRERLDQNDWSRFFSDDQGQSFLGIIRPIHNEPSCSEADCHVHPESQTVLGVLDVTMSLEGVHEEMVDSRNKAILLTAITIFSTSLIGLFLFHSRVGRPVTELAAATRRVAEGDLTTTIDVRRHDELGDLQRSFNEMTIRLDETQSQLYQSNKMASVGRLAAGIAHEINNPLTGVLTFSSLLLRDAPEGSELHEGLTTIVSETKRCRDIVKELLNFSRQVPPHKTLLDLNEVVEKALDIVDHQFTVNNIEITRGLAPNLPAVKADANKLGQVLLNLLVNASDAVEPGSGEVFVGTQTIDANGKAAVELKVSDNGSGISPEHQAQVFEPFFTTKDNGTGLGLAVVWGIVTEHEGTIRVSSRPGRGTTFTVRLPAATALELAPEEADHG
jgi:two-component system NtrC family sensor kinase